MGSTDTVTDRELLLVAYRVVPFPRMRLVRAPSARTWMQATDRSFANRCLPLLIANQAGWFLLSSHTVRATWTGGDDISSLRLDYLNGMPPYPAVSHFGHGILTWNIPYLFRTAQGYNLLVRGPSNLPKDGVCPLEGIVEADWSAATFTVNWKFTRPNHPVTFDVNEPICMLVPQRRGELEEFRPQIREIGTEPEIAGAYQAWHQSRTRFLSDLKILRSEAAKQGWQRDYFQGVSPSGLTATEHQTKLALYDFSTQNVAVPCNEVDNGVPGRTASCERGGLLRLREFHEPGLHGWIKWRSTLATVFVTLYSRAGDLILWPVRTFRSATRRR